MSTICPGILDDRLLWQLHNTGTTQHVQETTRQSSRLNIGGPDYSDPSCVLLPFHSFNLKQKHVGAGSTPAKNCQEGRSSPLFGIFGNAVSCAQTRGTKETLGSRFDDNVQLSLLNSTFLASSTVPRVTWMRHEENSPRKKRGRLVLYFVWWSNIRPRQIVLSRVSCWWASPAVAVTVLSSLARNPFLHLIWGNRDSPCAHANKPSCVWLRVTLLHQRNVAFQEYINKK